MKLVLPAIAVAMLPIAANAQDAACGSWQSIGIDQAREIRVQITEADDALDAYEAFQTLSCASNPVIRRIAVEQGAKSPFAAVKDAALFRALAELESFHIRLLDEEGMNPAQKARLAATPVLTFENDGAYQDRQCIGLDNNRCDPDRILAINGGAVRFKYNRIVGEFEESIPTKSGVGRLLKGELYFPTDRQAGLAAATVSAAIRY